MKKLRPNLNLKQIYRLLGLLFLISYILSLIPFILSFHPSLMRVLFLLFLILVLPSVILGEGTCVRFQPDVNWGDKFTPFTVKCPLPSDPTQCTAANIKTHAEKYSTHLTALVTQLFEKNEERENLVNRGKYLQTKMTVADAATQTLKKLEEMEEMEKLTKEKNEKNEKNEENEENEKKKKNEENEKKKKKNYSKTNFCQTNQHSYSNN